jgi:hypothetical protein
MIDPVAEQHQPENSWRRPADETYMRCHFRVCCRAMIRAALILEGLKRLDECEESVYLKTSLAESALILHRALAKESK